MDRRDVATWLSGPREALAGQGIDLGYRGERLGLPESGVGSVAGVGRRLGAIFIDWLACLLVARLFFREFTVHPGDVRLGFATLAIFFVMKSAFTLLGGSSFGQRLFGIRVISLTGKPYVDPLRSMLRTLLICLVVPAVIWDRDGRGLHDRAARTVDVRSRP